MAGFGAPTRSCAPHETRVLALVGSTAPKSHSFTIFPVVFCGALGKGDLASTKETGAAQTLECLEGSAPTGPPRRGAHREGAIRAANHCPVCCGMVLSAGFAELRASVSGRGSA